MSDPSLASTLFAPAARGSEADVRARVARLGLWLGLICVTMLFSGFLGAMVVQRASDRSWPPAGVSLDLRLGALSTGLILGASGLFALALARHKKVEPETVHEGLGEEGGRFAFLGGAVLAFAFLGSQAAQYGSLIGTHHQKLSSSPFASYFYMLTGMHALHLLFGIGWLGYLLVASGARPSRLGLELCGRYWHFMALLWVLLFAGLYF